MVRFEQRDGRPFPYPLVDVTVRGEPTRLMVDTGASHHALATWVLERAGVPVVKSQEAGFDHFGHSFEVLEARLPALVIEGWGRLEDNVVFAVDYPPVLETIDIGGILSPQQLISGGGGVVLDLRAGELRGVSPAEADAIASGELVQSGAILGVTHSAIIPPAPRYLVTASIADHVVKLVVDSGASRSNLFQGSPAGQVLLTQAVTAGGSMHSVAGWQPTLAVTDVALALGETTRVVVLDLVPGAPHPDLACDGKLGMDVLRDCKLLLRNDGLWLRCHDR